AGLNCPDIIKMSRIARQDRLCEYLFCNRFFGDNGSSIVPEAMQLIPVQQIRDEEFGVFLEPALERLVWKSDNVDLLLSEQLKKVFDRIKDNVQLKGQEIRLQLRRLLFFFASLQGITEKRYITTFLRSPMLLTYLDYVEGNQPLSDIKENTYRRFILQVLQEYFIGLRLPEEGWKSHDLYITMKPPTGHSSTQMVLKDLQTKVFKLESKPLYKLGDIESNILMLRFGEEDIELSLDLPFLDYVARRYQGEVAEQLSAYYADRLEQFKVKLLEEGGGEPGEQHSLRLLHIGANRNFQVMTVNVTRDNLEVLL
ncbi:MAG TPA: serine/threonine protein kinase, partial [Gelria sp.]|nr:serine/threonine protein kinase [Gelria sp.]